MQMYRTVKTDRAAAAPSAQSDVFDNGSSGDTSEDFMLDIENPRSLDISKQPGRPGAPQDKDYHALWSNSSSKDKTDETCMDIVVVLDRVKGGLRLEYLVSKLNPVMVPLLENRGARVLCPLKLPCYRLLCVMGYHMGKYSLNLLVFSREAWLHGILKDSGGNLPSLEQKDVDPKCLSYERNISDVSSPTLSGTSLKKPNLEFTLGRPL
ncbi:hypothetical protein NC652_001489 [Populus alba x Populus x berolinensis]|nr:hypothetical protein NC652_001489 [Populus alba x Populus x berolinensis]